MQTARGTELSSNVSRLLTVFLSHGNRYLMNGDRDRRRKGVVVGVESKLKDKRGCDDSMGCLLMHLHPCSRSKTTKLHEIGSYPHAFSITERVLAKKKMGEQNVVKP